MQTLFEKLYRGETLTLAESRELFSAIIRGELSETQLAAALISMKMRGEQPDEIAGAAQACLNNARAFRARITVSVILSVPAVMPLTVSISLRPVLLWRQPAGSKSPNTAAAAYRVKPVLPIY